jgi:hypothetical protein
MLQWVPQW